MAIRFKPIFLALTLLVYLCSCKKYLETKSVQTLITPSSLDDIQAILDNPAQTDAIGLTNTTTDEYYLKYADWTSRAELQRKAYVWDPQTDDLIDWSTQYNRIFYANTALFNIPFVDSKGQEEKKNNIQGSALFMRAHCFFQLAQLFAPQYDKTTASTDLGIVLRLNANFNENSVRSSVQQTYDRIVMDLEEALSLLPETSLYKNRPTKAACHALLARVYLQISEFEKAKENADKSLQYVKSLVDFKTLNSAASFPLGNFTNNAEILYYSKTSTPLTTDATRAKVDSTIYKSFASNDLRKKVFFKTNADNTYAFKGNYTGSTAVFNGIAVDEVYLIRAEAYARTGNTSAAMADLNFLLSKRFDASFVQLTAANSDQALDLILVERKKELLYRGLRWSDLRRLNKEPKFAITLKRNLNGQIYDLPPNDLRYTLLIPKDIIQRSGIQQNPR